MATNVYREAVSSADARCLLAAMRVLDKVEKTAQRNTWSMVEADHAAYGRLAEIADHASDVIWRVMLVAAINCGEQPSKAATEAHLNGG